MTLPEEIAALSALLAEPGQPAPVFAAFDAAMQRLVGHELLTMLYVDGDEVARIYSSRPVEYPLQGRKRMGPTPWGAHVLHARKPWFGRDAAAIRWAFPDHALIESMGLGSAINVPAVYDGVAIGTINLLAAEGFYDQAHIASVQALAPLLVPAFLTARAA